MDDDCRPNVAVIRPDGTGLRTLVERAVFGAWESDGASLLAETQLALRGAPLGGIVRVSLDGTVSDVILAHDQGDATGDICWPYGVLTNYYRGRR